jgi:hypothetical protein
MHVSVLQPFFYPALDSRIKSENDNGGWITG